MSIIDRYVISSFLSSYVLLLAVAVGTFVLTDVVFNLDEFAESADSGAFTVLERIADYHGNRLPRYFQLMGGVLMALAASFTYARMLRTNELTPLVASGMPLWRLAVPVLACSAGLAVIWWCNSEYVVPQFATKIARHYDDLSDARSVAVHCVRDDKNAILNASELHARDGWLKNVYILEPDAADGKPAHLIQADRADYDSAANTWKLERGRRLDMTSAFAAGGLGVPLTWEPIATYRFRLRPDQILLRQSSQWSDLLSFRQMNRLLWMTNVPNRPEIAKQRDIRFSQPLLMGILIMLVVPYFLTREPTNVLVAGGKALLLGGGCFLVAFICHSWSPTSPLAQFAAALPVLIFGPLAVLRLASVKT